MDSKREIHVQTWEELQSHLFYDTWDDKITRFRSSYIYRGLQDTNYNLKTSLARLGGDYHKLERHLLRNFRKYAHRDAAPGNSIWNWLAVAQHHGLPTRMLDWTYSPYIALHFTTNDLSKFHTDGVIWCLNYVRLNQFLPEKLKRVISKEESNTFTTEMLASVCSSLEALDNIHNEDYLIFLEPPSLDNRIINQFALFSMLSNPTTLLDDWLKKHEQYYFKIIIPAKLKWEIRDKLDQANITERVLFPGLEGLSLWLKRHYSSKDETNSY